MRRDLVIFTQNFIAFQLIHYDTLCMYIYLINIRCESDASVII